MFTPSNSLLHFLQTVFFFAYPQNLGKPKQNAQNNVPDVLNGNKRIKLDILFKKKKEP